MKTASEDYFSFKAVLTCSELLGLWGTDNRRNVFLIISAVLNSLDSLGKTYFFLFYLIEQKSFRSNHVLEAFRNLLSKVIILSHSIIIIRQKNKICYLHDMAQKTENGVTMTKRILLAGGGFVILLFCCSWVDFASGDVYDYIVTVTLLINHVAEVLIVLQFTGFLDLIKRQIRGLKKRVKQADLVIVEDFENYLSMCGKVEKLYCLQMLLIVGQVSLDLLSYSYHVVQAITCSRDSGMSECAVENPWISFSGVFWSISKITYSMFELLCMVTASESTSLMVCIKISFIRH